MEWGSEEDNLLPSRHLAGVGQPEGGGGGGEPHLQACQWELHSKIFQKPDPGCSFSPPRRESNLKSNLRRDRELECKS